MELNKKITVSAALLTKLQRAIDDRARKLLHLMRESPTNTALCRAELASFDQFEKVLKNEGVYDTTHEWIAKLTAEND